MIRVVLKQTDKVTQSDNTDTLRRSSRQRRLSRRALDASSSQYPSDSDIEIDPIISHYRKRKTQTPDDEYQKRAKWDHVQKDRRVVHSVSQMLSVINQTHSAVVQNRKHINVLQSYVQKVSDEVRHIANLWQNQDKQLQVINAKLRIEQCLSAMESAHAHWVQQTARFNRQKLR